MGEDNVRGGLATSRLRVSERCCELFITEGTTSLRVAEITAAVGVPPRTFHRYFPSKAECVAPVFDWTTWRFDDAVGSASHATPVTEALRAAFQAGFGGEVAGRTRALFPLVFGDAAMWSVFLRKVHDGERALAPALAPRLGLDPTSIAARAAAAAVASATRLALEAMVASGADAEDTYMEIVDAFASGVIRQK